jgi:hypothetical protein
LTSPHFFKITATADKPALPSAIGRLLASNSVTLPPGRMTVAQVDKLLNATAMKPVDRMNVKGALARAGLLD